MIIVLSQSIHPEEKQGVITFLEGKGYKIREIVGEAETVLGAVGLIGMDAREVEVLPGVERVIPISKPYKLASRELKKEDTVISLGPVRIGGRRVAVAAGPCAVESRDQMMRIAETVRASGAVMLRGGAFKPRTSPYDFQGLGEEGLQYLREAGDAVGLPVVSEVVATETVEMAAGYVHVFQIGARNMQNFELLKKVGAAGLPVILKRGMAAKIEEWLMAAEYLLAHGTEDVILCERGIRTFETYTRNTLDLSAIPVIKKLSHLPVIVDPSHATGIREKVPPMALAGIAAGADGLIVEVHTDPEHALSDGPQSLYPEQFEKLMRDLEALSPVIGKEIEHLPEKHPLWAVDKAFTGGKTVVAFQGEPGAYSEEALERYFFHIDHDIFPCGSFEEVFRAVLDGKARYGILPIENSLTGSIHENYDLLLRYPDIKIVGEKTLRIVHNLIGKKGTKIEKLKRVFSHPQGLAQCAAFLDKYPGLERVPFYDTAGSVAHVAAENREDWAAIAGEKAAAVYGMAVLKEGLETNPNNYTRFFICSRLEEPTPEEINKVSFVFSAVDKPGALFHCLSELVNRDLNMKKLESRPIHGRPWQYMFYIDLDITGKVDRFTQAAEKLKEGVEDFRILGWYRQGGV
ncbi:MAG: 3-deoxy-7-phosphoheptulonate synthase [Spirochaetales bacterium]|nr:3-deoxy-7-phosphoheptulonate synthase [Spirochaetales bacterium]